MFLYSIALKTYFAFTSQTVIQHKEKKKPTRKPTVQNVLKPLQKTKNLKSASMASISL